MFGVAGGYQVDPVRRGQNNIKDANMLQFIGGIQNCLSCVFSTTF
jgi:hypothetical protein